MTLKRMYDHYEMGYFARKQNKQLQNYWVTDDLSDVYKMQDIVSSGILFDKKASGRVAEILFEIPRTLLQFYIVFVNQRAQVILNDKEPHTIEKIVDGNLSGWPQGVLITPPCRELLEERALKNQNEDTKKTGCVLEIYDPVMIVFPQKNIPAYPIMISAFATLPRGRPKRKAKETLADQLALGRLQPYHQPAYS